MTRPIPDMPTKTKPGKPSTPNRKLDMDIVSNEQSPSEVEPQPNDDIRSGETGQSVTRATTEQAPAPSSSSPVEKVDEGELKIDLSHTGEVEVGESDNEEMLSMELEEVRDGIYH